ncbi:MAG: cation-translocating P-type ATPase [Burkholderiaceae bacterium]
MADSPQPDLIALDDPQEWSSFGRALRAAGYSPRDGDPADAAGDESAGQWESDVLVENIVCAACGLNIEAALLAVPGVGQVQVNTVNGRARVIWDAAVTRPSIWFAAARRAGYPMTPANGHVDRLRHQRQERRALWRWLVAALCMMQVMMYAYPSYVEDAAGMPADIVKLLRWASWMLTLPVLIFSCGPFFRQSLRDLRAGRIGMDLTVSAGLLIAFAASTIATFQPDGWLGREVYFDSVTMFVFFLLSARWLEARMRRRSADAIEALLGRLPDTVEVRQPDGRWLRMAVRRLRTGDRVRVYPGETFPGDGRIEVGVTQADESLLSGESTPVLRGVGQPVLAGSHNLSAVVEVGLTSTGERTRYGQIAELIRTAAVDRPRVARLADRIAMPFLVGVLLVASLCAAWWWMVDPAMAVRTAVAVLVVTCPCALSLATPAAMLAASGALARRGIMVCDLDAVERGAAIDTVVFDKTGTLTSDALRLVRTRCADGLTPERALALAALVARQSLHPASRALQRAQAAAGSASGRWDGAADIAAFEAVDPFVESLRVLDAEEVAGQGIVARVFVEGTDGMAPAVTLLRLGSASFCRIDESVSREREEAGDVRQASAARLGRTLHLSGPDGWLASFDLDEDLRPDAPAAVRALQAAGIDVHLLSGDRPAAVQALAGRVGIVPAQARGGCTPENKLAYVRELQQAGRRVAMVGDGINDAPVLRQAQVSFAMGRSVPLARASADFVVIGDDLTAVVATIGHARRCLRIIRENFGWALTYNAVSIPLAVIGAMPPWVAGLGMAASSLIVVANATRLARPITRAGTSGGDMTGTGGKRPPVPQRAPATTPARPATGA